MLVSLVLIVAAGWSDFPDPSTAATRTPPPKASQRREALDELQALLEQWQKERLDFAREHQLQLHAEQIVEASREAPALPAEAVQIQRGGTMKAGRGKVIEVAPRGKLEAELDEAEAQADARRAECAKNPRRCEAEKAKRAKTEVANDAFEDAIEKNFEKRRATIEAEAAKIQAAVTAAKQREANRQAKKLGGTVDEEGNFADDDLKAEPPPRK